MKNTRTRRVLSLLLSITLLFSQTGLTALAADVEAYTPGSLCEHHPSHTVECGYGEGVPCAHEHTASCYTDELICSLAESGNEIATTSGAPHTHTQECYEMDCPHADGQHDDTCSCEKVGSTTYSFNANGEATLLPQEKRYLIYTVLKGDSFWGIAFKYKVSMYELAAANGESIFSSIQLGDVLQVPQQ